MTAIGPEEKAAVMRVLDSGVLSGFIAGELYGGPEVNALEEEWAAYFGFKHAVAINSATSCLIAACGAVGIGKGDLVAVPPLTMSATATCMKPWGAMPLFCDIEADFFCIDPHKIYLEYLYLKAIITVDIFGQASNPNVKFHGLPVIQDASQRPMPGGFGDIVVHSLNYHKHIQCGEGGMACTNNDFYADKLRLIRNHAECYETGLLKYYPYKGLYGFNFRMTEIEAAIARVQLTKLPAEIKRRQKLSQKKSNLAPVRPDTEHAWYLYPHIGKKPKEGFKYQKPLTHLPFFNSYHLPVAEQVWESIWMTRP